MSQSKEQIEQIVLSVINNNCEGIELGIINRETLLLSEGSVIDSMTIVSIIVDLELLLSDLYNAEISLSDENAMSRDISPYTDVNSLIEFIFELSHKFNV